MLACYDGLESEEGDESHNDHEVEKEKVRKAKAMKARKAVKTLKARKAMKAMSAVKAIGEERREGKKKKVKKKERKIKRAYARVVPTRRLGRCTADKTLADLLRRSFNAAICACEKTLAMCACVSPELQISDAGGWFPENKLAALPNSACIKFL